MGVSREQLIFDVLANTSRAEGNFRNLGRSVAASSDDVAGLARRMDEISAKIARARVELAGDKDAQVRLDKLDLKMAMMAHRVIDVPVNVEGAARASVEISALDVELDHLSEKSGTAAKATSGLAGFGGIPGGGMGALIGAGVLLAPVVATLAVGMTGLGVAAYGVAKPIENAAQASGGLQANLAKLDPEQQIVARGILALGDAYAGFEKQLQPVLLADFGKGLRLAGTLLRDVEPAAAGTGKAIGGLVSGLNQQFSSATWEQFFRFLATTGVSDVREFDMSLLNLVHTLPVLVEDIQPATKTLLDMLTVASKLSAMSANVNAAFSQQAGGAHQAGGAIGTLDSTISRLMLDITPFSPDLRKVWDSLAGVATRSDQAAMSLRGTGDAAQHFQQVTIGTLPVMTGLVNKTITTVTPMDRLGKATSATSMTIQETGRNAFLATDPMSRLGKAADVLVGAQVRVADTGRPVVTNFDQQITRLRDLITGYRNALSAQENYINAQVTEGDDLKSLNQALQASHDRIGLKTAAERASYAATQTYIGQTLSTADAAVKSGKGIQGQISQIEQAIPRLEAVRGKTSEYRDELDKLKAILDKLRAEKLISEVVHVTGQGTWRFGAAPGGSVAGPGGKFQPGSSRAAGGLIPGSGNSDSYLAMLTPGEVVVPKGMVKAGAVDHLRGSLPGFASGGIVPSYSGAVAGLPPWTSQNQQATVTAISTAIARAMAAQALAAAQAAMTGAPGALGGPATASAAQAQAYARSRLSAYGWGGGEMGPLIALWNQESGWNRFARNPSSGAYGIPQALPPSKMGPAANPPASSAAAQINWGLGYIKGSYGSPSGAEAHEQAFHWYDKGGWLYPGTTLAVNNTGQPERVSSPAADKALAAALNRLAAALENAPERTGAAVGAVINGTARAALYAGRHSSR